MKDQKHHLETEQKIIHLMLESKTAIESMIDERFDSHLFDDAHRPIVDAIYDNYLNGGHLLTAESYRQICLNQGKKVDLPLSMNVFAQCDLKAYAVLDEFPQLKQRLIDSYVARRTNKLLKQFEQRVDQDGYYRAANSFVDQMHEALSLAQSQKKVFASFPELHEPFMESLTELKEHPEQLVQCGIPEIDDAVGVGFKPMHLTLFVGDVGSHKTNIMLNIAIQLVNSNYKVLFVPLEMPWRDLANRILANVTGIGHSKLSRPSFLSDEEMEKIKGADIWNQGGFYILDADERTTPSELRSELQRRAFMFKPDVVIIDYIAIMQPDRHLHGARNDIQIGEILKSLRFMGKKYRFHIISAAQMGRSAIKSLREGKETVPDTTSIRGSHEYSADADTIFVLMKIKDEDNRLKIYSLKARHGKPGHTKELSVNPEICRILTTNNGTQALAENINLEEPVEDALDSDVEFQSGFNDSSDDELLGL